MRGVHAKWRELFGVAVVSIGVIGVKLAAPKVLPAGFAPSGALAIGLVHSHLRRVLNRQVCSTVMWSLTSKRVYS